MIFLIAPPPSMEMEGPFWEFMMASKAHTGSSGGGMTDVHGITMQLRLTYFGFALLGCGSGIHDQLR